MADNTLSREELRQILGMGPIEPEQPERTLGGTLKDIGVTLGNAAIGAGESVVGLGNLATFGGLGKVMNAAGYDPKAARQFLSQYYSDAQKAANREVDEAKGFWGTTKAALRNPSTIAASVVESLPSMYIGGGIGGKVFGAAAGRLSKAAEQGSKTAAKYFERNAAGQLLRDRAGQLMMNDAGRRVVGGTAAAIGEGTAAMGSMAEQMRQENADKELTGRQALLAGLGGLGTGALGRFGNALANRAGIADVDTLVTMGLRNQGARNLTAGQIAKGIGGGALIEGLAEELPQSMQEQVWQNLGAGRPWHEGVLESGAQGMLAGAVMGGAGNIRAGLPGAQREARAAAEARERERIEALGRATFGREQDAAPSTQAGLDAVRAAQGAEAGAAAAGAQARQGYSGVLGRALGASANGAPTEMDSAMAFATDEEMAAAYPRERMSALVDQGGERSRAQQVAEYLGERRERPRPETPAERMAREAQELELARNTPQSAAMVAQAEAELAEARRTATTRKEIQDAEDYLRTVVEFSRPLWEEAQRNQEAAKLRRMDDMAAAGQEQERLYGMRPEAERLRNALTGVRAQRAAQEQQQAQQQAEEQYAADHKLNYTGETTVPARSLVRGDKVQVRDAQGRPDVATVKGYTDDGRVVLQDGVRMTFGENEDVPIQGISLNEHAGRQQQGWGFKSRAEREQLRMQRAQRRAVDAIFREEQRQQQQEEAARAAQAEQLRIAANPLPTSGDSALEAQGANRTPSQVLAEQTGAANAARQQADTLMNQALQSPMADSVRAARKELNQLRKKSANATPEQIQRAEEKLRRVVDNAVQARQQRLAVEQRQAEERMNQAAEAHNQREAEYAAEQVRRLQGQRAALTQVLTNAAQRNAGGLTNVLSGLAQQRRDNAIPLGMPGVTAADSLLAAGENTAQGAAVEQSLNHADRQADLEHAFNNPEQIARERREKAPTMRRLRDALAGRLGFRRAEERAQEQRAAEAEAADALDQAAYDRRVQRETAAGKRLARNSRGDALYVSPEGPIPDELWEMLAPYENQLAQGEAGQKYFTESESGDDVHITGHKSTYPAWFRKKTKYAKAYDERFPNLRSSTANEILNAIDKVRQGKGDKLGKKQRSIWYEMQDLAFHGYQEDSRIVEAMNTGEDYNLEEYQEAVEEGYAQDHGIEYTGDTPIPVSMLAPGDRVQLRNRAGEPDIATHKGYTKDGKVILKDGVEKHLKPTAVIDVQGIGLGRAGHQNPVAAEVSGDFGGYGFQPPAERARIQQERVERGKRRAQARQNKAAAQQRKQARRDLARNAFGTSNEYQGAPQENVVGNAQEFLRDEQGRRWGERLRDFGGRNPLGGALSLARVRPTDERVRTLDDLVRNAQAFLEEQRKGKEQAEPKTTKAGAEASGEALTPPPPSPRTGRGGTQVAATPEDFARTLADTGTAVNSLGTTYTLEALKDNSGRYRVTVRRKNDPKGHKSKLANTLRGTTRERAIAYAQAASADEERNGAARLEARDRLLEPFSKATGIPLEQLRAEYDAVAERYYGQPKNAPNGEPTNLTVEQWILARTPSFKERYGDWQSAAEDAAPRTPSADPAFAERLRTHGSAVNADGTTYTLQALKGNPGKYRVIAVTTDGERINVTNKGLPLDEAVERARSESEAEEYDRGVVRAVLDGDSPSATRIFNKAKGKRAERLLLLLKEERQRRETGTETRTTEQPTETPAAPEQSNTRPLGRDELGEAPVGATAQYAEDRPEGRVEWHYQKRQDGWWFSKNDGEWQRVPDRGQNDIERRWEEQNPEEAARTRDPENPNLTGRQQRARLLDMFPENEREEASTWGLVRLREEAPAAQQRKQDRRRTIEGMIEADINRFMDELRSNLQAVSPGGTTYILQPLKSKPAGRYRVNQVVPAGYQSPLVNKGVPLEEALEQVRKSVETEMSGRRMDADFRETMNARLDAEGAGTRTKQAETKTASTKTTGTQTETAQENQEREEFTAQLRKTGPLRGRAVGPDGLTYLINKTGNRFNVDSINNFGDINHAALGTGKSVFNSYEEAVQALADKLYPQTTEATKTATQATDNAEVEGVGVNPRVRPDVAADTAGNALASRRWTKPDRKTFETYTVRQHGYYGVRLNDGEDTGFTDGSVFFFDVVPELPDTIRKNAEGEGVFVYMGEPRPDGTVDGGLTDNRGKWQNFANELTYQGSTTGKSRSRGNIETAVFTRADGGAVAIADKYLNAVMHYARKRHGKNAEVRFLQSVTPMNDRGSKTNDTSLVAVLVNGKPFALVAPETQYDSIKMDIDEVRARQQAKQTDDGTRHAVADGNEPARPDRRAEVKAAVDLVHKLVPGLTVKNTTDLDGELAKLKGRVRHLRNNKGVIVGAYHAGSKTVLLTPEADASTVLHEVGWHAVYDWARTNAPELYRQMQEYAKHAPKSVQDWVKERYGTFTPEGLLDEIGARMFTEQGRADFEEAVQSRAGRSWYQRLADVFRQLWNRFIGAHRADLGAYQGLAPEEAMKRLLADITAGRRLEGNRTGRGEDRATRDMLVRFAKLAGVPLEQLQAEYEAVAARYAEELRTGRKAPNGKPSKLNERQWILVRTPRFKAWFGNWELRHKQFAITNLKSAPFNNNDDALAWAEKYGIIGLMTSEETGGKGKLSISRSSIREMLNPNQREPKDKKQPSLRHVHYAVLTQLKNIIKESEIVDSHPDYKKDASGKRTPLAGINPDVGVDVLYGAVRMDGKVYRVKTTVKRYSDTNRDDKAYAYRVEKIEVLVGNLGSGENASTPSTSTSISGAILLHGVHKVNPNDGTDGALALKDHSKVVDENGEPMVVYHQTGEEFTVFEPRRPGAGQYDNQLPFGIFLKPDNRDIGLEGKRQMALFANIKNPLVVANRNALAAYLAKNVPGYAELQRQYEAQDNDYGRRLNELETQLDSRFEAWEKKNPNADADERGKAYDGIGEELGESALMREWEAAEQKLSAQMKELVDKHFRESGHDGIILERDEGGFGKKTTRTIIAFERNQVKSATDNTGAFDPNNDDIRYTFAGEQGAAALDRAEEGTHRLDNLAVARDMEAAGKDAKTVKLATGWERGKDGKWRYEIDDSGNKLNERPEIGRNSTGDRMTTLARLYDAPELFKAYPDLKNMAVEFVPLNEGTRGQVVTRFGGEQVIQLSDRYLSTGNSEETEARIAEIENTPEFRKVMGTKYSDPDFDDVYDAWDNSELGREYERLKSSNDEPRVKGETLGTLVHEIQHAIQDIEGFAPGGNLKTFEANDEGMVNVGRQMSDSQLERAKQAWDAASPELQEKFRALNRAKIAEDFNELDRLEAALSDDESKAWLDYSTAMDTALEYRKRGRWKTPGEAYEALAGEVEARNTQTRLNMTAEQRRASLAEETEDVAREDQIVLQEMMGTAASVEAPRALTPAPSPRGRGESRQEAATSENDEPRRDNGRPARRKNESVPEYNRRYQAWRNQQREKEVISLFQAAYHGSPFRFSKFTLDKIGTGEGSQVHGWGLYFSLDRDLAERYWEQLTGGKTMRVNGRTATNTEKGWQWEDGTRVENYSAEEIALDALYKTKNQDEALRSLARQRTWFENNKAFSKESLATNRKYQNLQAAYEFVKSSTVEEKPGQVYRVDIPEDHEMLREDAELADQPEQVKKALEQALERNAAALRGADMLWAALRNDEGKRHILGRDLYWWLKRDLGSPKAASLALNEAGIKGIRYEGRRDGECAVVWDDTAVEILETYYQAQQDGKNPLEALKKLYGQKRAEAGQEAARQAEEAPGVFPHRNPGESLPDYIRRRKQWAQGQRGKLWRQVQEQIRQILPDKAQAGAIIGIIRARAASAGISPEEFVSRRALEFRQAGKMDGLKGAFNPDLYAQEGRAIISAFEAADVSTLAHELAHMFRQDLERFGQMKLLGMAERWAGVKNHEWTPEQEEKFARAFERYLREGKAPTNEMKGIFARFRDWLTNIYRTLKGSEIDVELSPEITRVFDALLTENAALDLEDGFGAVFKEVDPTSPEFKEWYGEDWEVEKDGRGDGRQDQKAWRDNDEYIARGRGQGSGGDHRRGTAGNGLHGRPGWQIDVDTGKPRIYYHGTKDTITAFDIDHPNKKDHGWLGPGVYATSSKNVAEMYATVKRGDTKVRRIMPLYVAVLNPYPATNALKQFLRKNPHLAPDFTRWAKEQGYDGVVLETVTAKEKHYEIVAFEEWQVKSAERNTGAYSRRDTRLLFQTAANPAANNTVTGQSFVDRILDHADPKWRDRWERFIYNFLDTNDPRERVWKKAGTPTDQDFVTVERLRGKKTAAEQKKFREDMVTPLLQTLGRGKLSVSDLEEYAYALHTPERNQRMREVNAKRTLDELAKHMSDADRQNLKAQMEFVSTQGAANGWTQADIQQEYLNMMQDVFRNIATREAALPGLPQRQRDAERRRIDETKKIRDRWNEESIRFAGQTDAEAQAVIDKWQRDSRFATLQQAQKQMADISAATLDVLHEAGELDDEEYQGMKDGYQYYVPLHRDGFLDTTPIKLLQVAKGSRRNVVNILPNVVRSHDAAIARKYKIEAGKALYDFAQAHPDAGISIEELEKKPTHDREGNVVMYTSQAEPEDGIFIRYNGRKMLLRFAADSRTAEGRTLSRFLDSVKGSDAQLNGLTNMLHRVTGWLSSVNTTLNPEFIVTNFSRDLQTAFIHLNQKGIDMDGLQKAVAHDIFPAMKGIWAAERGNKNTVMGRWYADYTANGGKVGWAQGYEQAVDVAKELESELKRYQEGHRTYKAYKNMRDLVDNANAAIENCMRLATYKNLVERGVSKQQAARVASSLTVDFTQHGKMGPQINALYMFWNASVQGSVRMVQALASSKKVRAIAGGIAGAGFVLQMLALAGGGDDDSGEPYILGIPDAIRERNIIIMLPGGEGKYIKIPKAYGYGAIYDFGAELANSIYMGAQGRKYDHTKGAMRVVNSFANSFNPIQSATMLQTLAPTLLDPVAYVAENKTWAGTPLMPEQNPYGPPKPDSERFWKGTSPVWKKTVAAINDLTGGDKYQSGWADVSPETLSMIWDNATGGMGRFIGNTLSLPFTIATGDTEAHKVPFARQVFGTWNDRAISSRYYEAMDRAEIAHMRFKNAENLADRKRLYATPEHKLYLRTRNTEKQIKALRKRQQAMEAAGNRDGAERIRTRIVAAQSKVLAAMQ